MHTCLVHSSPMTDDTPGTTDGHSPRRWHPLLDRAARIGHLVWFERQLFERFGAWAGTTGLDSVDVAYGELSRRHGWHAQVLFERLPELSVVDPDSLVVAPGPATAALVEHLGTLDQAPAARRWWVSHRVVAPLTVTTLRSERLSVDPLAEPSLGRWLGILIADDVEELLDGDATARRIVAPDALDDVIEAQATAERLAHATDLLRR